MKFVLKAAVSLGLMAFALQMLDLHAVVAAVKRVNAVTFFFAVTINLGIFAVLAIRWHLLVASTVRLGFLRHAAHYFTGTFLNSFTPANLGGDAYRWAMLRSDAGSSFAVVKVLIRERLLGLMGYLLGFCLALAAAPELLNYQLVSNPFAYGALLSMSGVGLLAVWNVFGSRATETLVSRMKPRYRTRLTKWLELATCLLTVQGSIPVMVLTMLGVVLWTVSIQVVAGGFGMTVPLSHLAAVAVLVEIIRLIPITIQGIGLREGTFAYLLGLLGQPTTESFVVATVSYIALSVAVLGCALIGALLMWWSKRSATIGYLQ